MKSRKIKSEAGINANPHEMGGLQLSQAQREQMISMAAYFRAEKRGFQPNGDLSDWFESEREIDSHLNGFSS